MCSRCISIQKWPKYSDAMTFLKVAHEAPTTMRAVTDVESVCHIEVLVFHLEAPLELVAIQLLQSSNSLVASDLLESGTKAMLLMLRTS